MPRVYYIADTLRFSGVICPTLPGRLGIPQVDEKLKEDLSLLYALCGVAGSTNSATTSSKICLAYIDFSRPSTRLNVLLNCIGAGYAAIVTCITATTRVRAVVRIGAGLFALVALGQVGAFAAQTPSVPVGSGTISFALPARYGTGVSITSYLCRNTFLSPHQLTNFTSPLPEEPAMGVQGLLNGHTFQALFSADYTFVNFENISLTPAMDGGPAPTYVQGQHVAGTIAIATRNDEGTRRGSGSVTIDITCTGGVTPVASTISSVPTHSGSSPSGTLIAIGVALLTAVAGAAALGLTRMKSQRLDDPHRCAKVQVEVEAAEAAVKAARMRGDAHYRAMGDLRLEGAILGEDENPWSDVQKFETDLAAETRAAEERLARAREALRICLAGGPDAVSVNEVDPSPQTFNPLPPKSDEPGDDPSGRQEIG